MTDKQKVLFKQIQLAGLGIVVGFFGFFVEHKALMIIGACIFAFGIIRTIVIKKLVDKLDDDENESV